ncbi:MAG: nitroreductase family protein [Chloroflexi bacterium]|nr:MAG: nitroreductase family protein [Chloroflexota bacterium]
MKCGMATLTDLLESRRSTRRFDPDRDVAADVLERVLRAPLTMPHAGNTYDWRAVVLSRRDRDPDSWPRVFEALLGQSYVDEAAVVIVWAVQPGWWAENYRRNIADLVERRLLDPERAGSLLELAGAGPETELPLGTALAGEAMMGLAAAMLVAIDAGLGATVTACRPAMLARALGLPEGCSPSAIPWAARRAGPPSRRSRTSTSAPGGVRPSARSISADRPRRPPR